MLQKISNFFAQFNITKHTLVVLYTGLFTLFQTNDAFKTYALNVYGMFPHWLSAMVVGLIVPLFTFYHLGLTAPAQAAVSNTVKSIVIALAMLFGLGYLTLGCTPSSTQTAVKNIVAYLPTAQALANEGGSIATLFDPQDQAKIAAVEALVSQNITSLTAIGNTYLATPSASNWQSVVNAVNALVTNADAQLLAAAHITDPASQTKATAILGAIDLAIHVIDSYVEQAQPPATVSATAAKRTTKLYQLEPLWPKDRMTPEVAYGVRLGERMGF